MSRLPRRSPQYPLDFFSYGAIFFVLSSRRRQARRCLGYIQCCWAKSGNLAVAPALVDLSETGLISWFNVHALARMSCQQSEQLMATLAELGAYNHLKPPRNKFLPRIRLAWRAFIATGPRPCFGDHGPPINKAQRPISRAKSP
jgi:hypothetical protein